jgi:hypothetical protein
LIVLLSLDKPLWQGKLCTGYVWVFLSRFQVLATGLQILPTTGIYLLSTLQFVRLAPRPEDSIVLQM